MKSNKSLLKSGIFNEFLKTRLSLDTLNFLVSFFIQLIFFYVPHGKIKNEFTESKEM